MPSAPSGLGRGTGLTPAGDDLVAGALATLRATGLAAADRLGAAVRAPAPAATTRLSAALLEAADVGGLVPEAAGVPARAGRRGDVETAAGRLVDVGHTSGWHLAAGLLVGVTHAGGAERDRLRRSKGRIPARRTPVRPAGRGWRRDRDRADRAGPVPRLRDADAGERGGAGPSRASTP